MKLAFTLIPWAILAALWASWQTEGRAVFSYPRGIWSQYDSAGDAVHYYLVVGKDQPDPVGTVWRTTIGDGWRTDEPMIDGLTITEYFNKHAKP